MKHLQNDLDKALGRIAEIKEQTLSNIREDFEKAKIIKSDVQVYEDFFKDYLKTKDVGDQLDLVYSYSDKLDHNTSVNFIKYMDILSNLFYLYSYSLVDILNLLLEPIRKGYNHHPVLDAIKAFYTGRHYHNLFGTYFNLTPPSIQFY